MKLEVVQGKKGPKDKVVLVTANREPLKIEHLLWILQQWFESEDACYPISEGYEGRAMLLKAIIDIYSGHKIETVLKRYFLKPSRDGYTLNVNHEGGENSHVQKNNNKNQAL
jgi:hypothetical protein